MFSLEEGKNNKEKRPYITYNLSKYLKTPEEAAVVIKVGIGWILASAACRAHGPGLANRRDGLTDVKIRGGLVYQPIIHTVDCDPEMKHFSTTAGI